MKSRMICLAVGMLANKMVLAKPVYTSSNHLAADAGTILDELIIQKLLHQGIKIAWVYVQDTRSDEQIEKEIQRAISRVDYIFRKPSSHFRDKLRDDIIDYRLMNLQ